MSKNFSGPERRETFREVSDRAERLESLIHLSNDLRQKERRVPINFNDYLHNISKEPDRNLRDVFQVFSDMIFHYVPEGTDDYHISNESIGFINYDFSKIFTECSDNPYFADRLFANRLIALAEGFRKGTQKNNIFLFEGPPGSGKSTFLNNLLQKLEEFSKIPEGTTYKLYWRLNKNELGGFNIFAKSNPTVAEEMGELGLFDEATYSELNGVRYPHKYLEFSCPNHDNPILIIPKSYRKRFLDELIPDEEFKNKLFNERQFEWVLKDVPCNICTSIYNALIDEIEDPLAVFNMVFARKNYLSRQLGEGISIFNPGDEIISKPIVNTTLQKLINDLFLNYDIKFIHSYLAKTNNGVLALMDIKENNVERLKNFHGIISDGVHKVKLAEENINTMFLGLVNPDDKKHFEKIPSFQDRIISIKVPYILDYNTEISIYKNKFGENIVSRFLPGVLENFSKIIISSRLDLISPVLKGWIKKPEIYSKYVDKNLLLLKMDVYTGKVPDWLTDEDVRGFNRQTRLALVEESVKQGTRGFSGRQSLIIVNKFLSNHDDPEKLITMDMVKVFFANDKSSKHINIPTGFIDSLIDMYDYNVLQEVKEAIYYYNESQLSKEILDYLFAINFEVGTKKKCEYTGNLLNITEDYFKGFESIFMNGVNTVEQQHTFRQEIHSEYISKALSQDIQIKGKKITETDLYIRLFDKYTKILKENSLAPYINNENFRRAILDYGTKNFKAYDSKLRRDIKLLLTNLCKKFSYSKKGARQISLYVLDKDLPKKY